MNITSNIFIVFALLSLSVAAAYSQDCNSYLQRATELVSQKQYCDAKRYYQDYGKCNADADVSTEIAMCERFCKINVMEGEEDETVSTTDRDNPPPTVIPPDNRMVKPVPSVSTSAKFRLGLNGGLLYPTEKAEEAKRTYLFFGGGISGEYLIMPNIGVGLSAGYYGYEVNFVEEGRKVTASLIPVTLTGKYYFLTENVQPYGGVDVGLYTLGAKVKGEVEWESADVSVSESESESFFGLAPVVGLQYKLSNALSIDVSAKYNLIFSEGESAKMFGFNVGIVYTFGK